MNTQNSTILQVIENVLIKDIEIDPKISIRAKNPDFLESNDFKWIKSLIRKNGIIPPITVSYDPGTGIYKVNDGAVRVMVCVELGYESIPAMVNKDRHPAEVYLHNNINRIDLTAIEKAEAYENMYQVYKGGMNERDYKIAGRMGIKPTTLSDYRSIAALDDDVKNKYRHCKDCWVSKIRNLNKKNPKAQERFIEEHLQKVRSAKTRRVENKEQPNSDKAEELTVVTPKEDKTSINKEALEGRENKKAKGQVEKPDKKSKPGRVASVKRMLNKSSKLFYKKIEECSFSEKEQLLEPIKEKINELEKMKQEIEDEVTQYRVETEKHFDSATDLSSAQSIDKVWPKKDNEMPINQQNPGGDYVPKHEFPIQPS